jgi:phosphoribosylformylglycinamidine (FGAM) synthase PurS component
MVEVSAVSEEEKQQAKSLLARISENKLVNTIIVAVVGEATKAVLPHK